MFAEIRAIIDELAPTATSSHDALGEDASFALPVPSGADYQFRVIVEGAEATISATRIGGDRDEYFWYHAFADWHAPSEAALCQAACSELRALLTSPTRIVQSRGMLMWKFSCLRAEPNSDNWQVIHSHAATRVLARVPRIEGSSRTYSSPPVSPPR